jgi:PKD repeat protein
MTLTRSRILRAATQTAAALLALTVGGCTMHDQEEPPLSGPSEFATSITVSVSPDVLSQDGASQSNIVVTARDINGQPIRNLSLRVEILVDGVVADFGTLSARNLVTGADGRATLTYTAPAAPSVAVDNGTIVTIAVTPIGTDFNNSATRTAALRLVPPGIVVPPDGMKPAFTFTPTSPTDSQTVLFDASSSTSNANNPITGFSWNFGDGGRASGVTASHAFASAGSFVVTLTVSDAIGRTASKAQSITVSAGANPTAAFVSSPADPLVNQLVNFNASASRATPGRTIVKYEWDFGDGKFGTGVIASHAYTLARSYVVTLTVTDDSGKIGTATGTVTPK